MAGESSSEGGWPGGWLFAVMAGVIAAILARWIGDVTMAAAVLAGMFVFLVFGVLLGMFWTAPPEAGRLHSGDQALGHDAHGPAGDDPGGHVRADHAAAEPAEVPSVAAAPVAAVTEAVAPVAPEPAPAVQAVTQLAEPAAVAAAETKPTALPAPREGRADKLQTIEGIGPAMEKLCHELGIYHFDQIASWGVREIAWMDSNLKGFKGRVTRDKWVSQAKLIVEVGTEEFLRRAKMNDY